MVNLGRGVLGVLGYLNSELDFDMGICPLLHSETDKFKKSVDLKRILKLDAVETTKTLTPRTSKGYIYFEKLL